MRCVLLLLLLLVSMQRATGRTYVIPHILERSGVTGDTTSTFDTTIFATYTGLLSANVDVFLYDTNGQLMQGAAGGNVCAPCSYSFSGSERSRAIRIDDAIMAAGGFGVSPIKVGFAVVVVGGVDPDGMALEAKVAHSLGTLGDYSVANVPLDELVGEPVSPRILPFFIEGEGSINTVPYSFDTTIYAVYAGGLGAWPSQGGGTVDIYLYDGGGDPLKAAGGPVCAPCTITVNEAARKATVRIDQLIMAAGGFSGGPGSIENGFAILVVGGADPSGVTTGAFVVNSHSGPFDLGITWMDTRPIGAVTTTYVMPHFLDRQGATQDTPFTYDTIFYLTYTGGLAGIPAGGGATADFYLYAQGGTEFVRGADGQPVCGPCTFALNGENARETIRVEDLIMARGGFARSVETGHAFIALSGADPDRVNVQALVVNSHEQRFDLSIFPVAPQPVYRRDWKSPGRASFVLPHVFETAGRVNTTPHAMDDNLYLFYAGGLAGIPVGDVVANVYLFDGPFLLEGDSGAVCAPCVYKLDATQRSAAIGIESALGSLTRPGILRQPYAVIDARGDVANLAVGNMAVNSHSSVFDASVFGSEISVRGATVVVPRITAAELVGELFQIKFETDIGPRYILERRDASGGTWAAELTVTGDGVEKTHRTRLRATPQIYRLRVE